MKKKTTSVAVKTPPHFRYFCQRCGYFFDSRLTQPFSATKKAFTCICGGCYQDLINEDPSR